VYNQRTHREANISLCNEPAQEFRRMRQSDQNFLSRRAFKILFGFGDNKAKQVLMKSIVEMEAWWRIWIAEG